MGLVAIVLRDARAARQEARRNHRDEHDDIPRDQVERSRMMTGGTSARKFSQPPRRLAFGEYPPPASVVDKARKFGAALKAALQPPPAATACVSEIGSRDAARVLRRASAPKGPMHGMGHQYLDERLEAEHLAHPVIHDLDSEYGRPSYEYEILNLVDGVRTICEVRDDVSAIIKPVSSRDVLDYLNVLEKLKLLESVR